MEQKKMKIKIAPNGPYLVSGGVPLERETVVSNGEGVPVRYERGEDYPGKETYALCRCGGSHNKPYCDGTHSKIGFDGTETASRRRFDEQAVLVEGPGIDLADVQPLCARLRFCQRNGGIRSHIKGSGDPVCKEEAIEIAGLCSAGRLVARDKKGNDIEPRSESAISVLDEPEGGVGGPLWVKNCVPIESSDGSEYEKRNRVTLCRCGGSKNKPFCDGSHYKQNENPAVDRRTKK